MSPLAIIMLAVGLLAGAALGWALAGSRAAREKARADELAKLKAEAAADFDKTRERLSHAEKAEAELKARLEETDKRLAEQKALISDVEAKFKDAFSALASEALKSSNKSFLELAEEKFKGLKEAAAGDLESRKTAVESLVKPLGEALEKYQKQAHELEKKRSEEMGGVAEQLRTLAISNEQLKDETSKLTSALKAPQVRGRWGEIALRRAAELAGMSAYCDFVEQVSRDTDEGRLRPDMIVRLPAGREVVVDAKTPLRGYLDAIDAEDEADRASALERHAGHVRAHVDQLASKKYWSQFGEGLDLVVMFIPNDSFLAAAADVRPDIIEYAVGKNVMITTPTTFIALLKAIALGWREAQLAENAKQISQLAQDLFDRIAVVSSHLGGLGKSLGDSIDKYNKAISSIESRLYPAARKFKELGVSTVKEIEAAPQIDTAPRRLTIIQSVDPEEYK